MKLFFLLIAATLVTSFNDAPQDNETSAPKKQDSREFEFNYGASFDGIEPGKAMQIWIPIAQNSEQQNVAIKSIAFSQKAKFDIHFDKKYGNKIGFLETVASKDGKAQFNITYSVKRREAVPFGKDKPLADDIKKKFLAANSLVPIDGKPLELIRDTDLPGEQTAAGALLYNVVYDHMAYDKSKPGYGTGNSIWACDSKTGNCTDFHSLFISLARSQKIPARFEIGFPLPVDKTEGTIGGYHCWAWFHSAGQGWVPVDISEADKDPKLKDYYFGKLTADRVTFSTGRDIELVPAAKSGPRNYFVYPHVEVDGKELPKANMKPTFSFKNI